MHFYSGPPMHVPSGVDIPALPMQYEAQPIGVDRDDDFLEDGS
jgi:hypothetical protein